MYKGQVGQINADYSFSLNKTCFRAQISIFSQMWYNDYMPSTSPYYQTDKPPFIQSFGHASDGLIWIILHERNFQYHLIATILTTLAGLFFDISVTQWLILIFFFTLIPVLELINTTGEIICNIIRDELHLSYAATKIPRDLLAGSVLYASLGAVIAGAIIFLPKFYQIMV